MAKNVSNASTDEVAMEATTDFRIFRFLSSDSIVLMAVIDLKLVSPQF
jgi:hypothetical protein